MRSAGTTKSAAELASDASNHFVIRGICGGFVHDVDRPSVEVHPFSLEAEVLYGCAVFLASTPIVNKEEVQRSDGVE